MPTVLAVGTVFAVPNAQYSRKKSSFLLFTCVGLEDQRNPEEKGKKQYFMLENYQDSEHKGAFCGLGFF